MTPPVAITLIFVGGLIVIPAFDRWAVQVTEALVFILAIVVLEITILIICDRWPDYYGNLRVPIVMTDTLLNK